MSNNFSANISLNAGQSNKSITTLTRNVTNLSKALDNLDKSIQQSNSGMESIATSVGKSTAAVQQAIDASKQLIQQRNSEAGATDQSVAAEKKRTDAFQQSARTSSQAATSMGKSSAESAQATRGLAVAQSENASRIREAQGATDSYSQSLASHRYLMYDVGATYRSISVALLAIPAATSAVAIAYEKDFAQVQRTTGLAGDAAHAYNRTLKNLATEIPSTFGELAEVSKIGGQMGVAQQSLESFTDTVVRFVETSDGVNIDKASTAFGRLENMFNVTPTGELADPNFFKRIGSAIAYTGDNSVATEQAIIGMLEKTTASAKNAGLSVQETIAMSSAMVSSGLQPFLSSGFIIRFFGNFQKAAAQGGVAVDELARTLGYTADEFQNLVRNDPYQLLHRVTSMMKDMDSVEGKQFLTKLGINGVQDPKVLNALSANLHVLEDAMNDVNTAYGEASYLDESSEGIFNTTAANIQKMVNAFANLGATISSANLPIFNYFIESLTRVVSGIDNLVERSELARTAMGLFMAGIGTVGIIMGFRSALAFVNASLVMFRDAASKGALAGGRFGGMNRQIAESMLYAKGATEQQVAALLKGRSASDAYRIAILAKRDAIAKDTAATQANIGATAGKAAADRQAAGATTAATAAQVAAITATGKHAKELTGLQRITHGAGSVVGGLAGSLAGLLNPALLIPGAIIGIGTSMMNSKANVDAFNESIVEGIQGLGNFEGSFEALVEKLQEQDIGFWQKFFNPDLKGANIGDNFIQIAELAEISGERMRKAFEGGSQGMTDLLNDLKEQHAIMDSVQNRTAETGAQRAQRENTKAAISLLQDYIKELEHQEEQEELTARMTGEGADAMGEMEEALLGASNEANNFSSSLSDAIDTVFGLVNAEGAVTSALENMGKGLAESTDMSSATTEGIANINNYQQAVSAAIQLMQQQLSDGTFATVTEASAYYESFFAGLEQQLLNAGVDPTQAALMTQNALDVMQMTLMGAEGSLEIPIGADPTGAFETTTQTMIEMSEIINSGVFEFQLDANGQPATQVTWAVVNWIAEQMGITPEAVLDAVDGTATENTELVHEYLLAVTNEAYIATLDADGSPGKANVADFYNYASDTLGNIAQGIAATASDLNGMIAEAQASGVGIARQMIRQYSGQSPLGRITTTMSPAQAAAKRTSNAVKAPKLATPGSVAAPSIPAPDFSALNRGYNDAAKAAKKAGGAGKKAGGAGKKGADAAKKATDRAKEAAEKAAQAARDWNKEWSDLQSWAGRVGEALQMAFDKKHAVQSAKDEYYSVLNGINDRLKQQKDRVKELREETKRLTAERKVELNEAQKFENMSAIAAKHGNTERATDYRDQAKAMRERAAEMTSTISANKAEQSTIQAGIGNLNGYSQAAIDNRNELRQLEQAAMKVPQAYASIGASAATVATRTRQWTGAVRTHAKELGYTNSQVNANTVATSSYIRELNRVPRNIPTVVSASHSGVPAVNKALNNVARGRNSTVGARTGATSGTNRALNNVAGDRTSRITAQARTAAAEFALNMAARARTVTMNVIPNTKRLINSVFDHFFYAGGEVPAFNSGGLIPGQSPANPREDNLMASVDGQGHIMVRSGEYIHPEPAVKYYGIDFMEKIRTMQLPKYYMGGQVGGSSSGGNGDVMPMDLSAKTINLLADKLKHDISLNVGYDELARTTSKGQLMNDQKRGIFHD